MLGSYNQGVVCHQKVASNKRPYHKINNYTCVTVTSQSLGTKLSLVSRNEKVAVTNKIANEKIGRKTART